MVCLDTGFLVALLRGDQEAASTAETLDRANARKTTTPINAFELLLGAQLSKQREENLPLVRELLKSLALLEFDVESCEAASSISSRLRAEGTPIGIQDTMVAGMAVRHGEVLVTRNTPHFSRVKDLALRAW